jgi:MoxR-like ATPase
MATQNPIEHEGVYPLPEAQIDRFMLKLRVDYPSSDDEVQIVQRRTSKDGIPEPEPVLDADQIERIRERVRSVHVEPAIAEYAVSLVSASRSPESVALGASPRASIYLVEAARAHAFLEGRDYVVPHDVKQLAPEVLRHRLLLTYEAEADGQTPDAIIGMLLSSVPTP